LGGGGRLFAAGMSRRSLDLAHQQLTLAQARLVAERAGRCVIPARDLNLAGALADRILCLIVAVMGRGPFFLQLCTV